MGRPVIAGKKTRKWWLTCTINGKTDPHWIHVMKGTRCSAHCKTNYSNFLRQVMCSIFGMFPQLVWSIQCQDAREILYQALRCHGFSFRAAYCISEHDCTLNIPHDIDTVMIWSIDYNNLLYHIFLSYQHSHHHDYPINLHKLGFFGTNFRPQAMSVAEDGTVDTWHVQSFQGATLQPVDVIFWNDSGCNSETP